MRLIFLLLLFLPGLVSANDVEVDVELFLAVDVSRSMSPAELEIQRRGYAEAITSPEVLATIRAGMLGRIALTYVEWAGEGAQRVVVPWSLLETQDQAREIADTILFTPDTALRRTSISGAIDYAARDFDGNGFTGLRQVIDVSGDGPNNQGKPVTAARDAAVARGLTINGLPLMTQDALSDMWGIPDLDLYYENCVIGGTGAFVVPVLEWDHFAAAVRRKLILEIAAVPSFVVPVQYQQPEPYDCLIGERMWQENRTFFVIP